MRRAPAVDRPGRDPAGRNQRTDGRARRRDPRFDDGGDGGLFSGILARNLADAAVRRPELARRATRLVLASAAAAWQGRVEVTDGPVFAPDWRQPARTPGPGVPESDLSVQLSAWMLLEAAATAARAGVATTVENRDPT